MERSVRLRMVFEDKKMLKKWQIKSGLKRSWVSLKPCLTNVSDVVVYLIDAFQLHHTCPNGIILSMDGFVLPPFESTSILKDKDIISVKRKEKSYVSEKLAIVENQLVNTGLELPANEGFQNETEGYKSESEDNEPEKLETIVLGGNATPDVGGSQKGKASKEIKSPKKKKYKYTTTEECLALPVDKDGIHHEENGTFNGGDDDISAKEKNVCNDIVPSILHQAREKSSNSETEEDGDRHNEPSPSSDRLSLPQENLKGTEDASHKPGGTKKGPSECARCKKAKRQWLREMAKISKLGPQQRLLFTDNQLSAGNKDFRAPEECQLQVCKRLFTKKESQIHKESSNRLPKRGNAKYPEQGQQPDHESNEDDEIVPVVICPGHIRFESCEKGQSPDQNQVANIHRQGVYSRPSQQSHSVSYLTEVSISNVFCFAWGRDLII